MSGSTKGCRPYIYISVLAAFVALLALGGNAGADPFEGTAGPYWYECYDMTVGSTESAVNIDLEPRANIEMYDPKGAKVEMYRDVNMTGKSYSFQPAIEGRYSFWVYGSRSTYYDYLGFCTHQVVPRTHYFDDLIFQDQNITYRFMVEDINIPLIVCIDWVDDWDRIYPDVFDPDMKEMNIDLRGDYSESCYIIKAWKTGVYTVVFNGVRIESEVQITFNASANYPVFTGKVTDLADGDGSTSRWAVMGAIVLVLIGVVAVVLFVLMRSGRLTVSATVEEDYSYPVSDRRYPEPPPVQQSKKRPPGPAPGGQIPPWADPRERAGPPRQAPRPPPPATGQHGTVVQGIGTGMPPPAAGETRCVSCGRSFEAGTSICPYCGLPE